MDVSTGAGREELRRAAESIVANYHELNRMLPLCGGIPQPIDKSIDKAVMLARAYLAHPPLTRERVAKAVAELFHAQAQFVVRGGGMVHLDGLTEHLCRLLGVDS